MKGKDILKNLGVVVVSPGTPARVELHTREVLTSAPVGQEGSYFSDSALDSLRDDAQLSIRGKRIKRVLENTPGIKSFWIKKFEVCISFSRAYKENEIIEALAPGIRLMLP